MAIHLVPACTEQQLLKIENLYMEAFPKEERKPFSLLIEKSREGTVDILSIESDGNGMIGEAIVAKDRELALLDYFAVSPQLRNGGVPALCKCCRADMPGINLFWKSRARCGRSRTWIFAGGGKHFT